MANLSVLVLTYNEEANLRGCLESVRWSDDIHVVDSGSTDGTASIARECGAQLHVHPFEHFAAQRNWALRNVPFQNEWVFVLDADERISPDLAAELQVAVSFAGERVAGFELRRKVYFVRPWIKYAGQFNRFWFLRFFRHRVARYEERTVNEYPLVEGEICRLHGSLIHDNHKGVTDLITKFDSYATLEAEETVRLRRGAAPADLPAHFGGAPAERRRWLKHLFMRMPFRAVIKFAYLYVFCGGFLDGAPGFFYCTLIAVQEFLVAVKVGALTRNLPVR